MRLDELLEFYSTNSLSWEQLEYDRGDFYNLHYGLIHVGLPTLVDSSKYNLPTIKEDFLPRNYELVKDGDVAFADASEDTNEVAKAIEFTNTDSNQIVCGLHTIHGRDKDDRTKIGFKGFYFSSPAFHNQVRRLAQGTKIFSISTKILSECFVSLPSKDEQTKIANLLSLIDERIALQSKLIDRLKSLMDGIRHRLFEESTVHQSLGNIVEIRKGKQINGSELLDYGEYPVMNGGITPSGFLNEYNIPAGTISISEGGNSCGYVQFNATPIWSGGHCYTLHLICGDIDYRYLYHFLKHSESEIMKLRIGSGLPNIQKKDLSKFPITSYPISNQMKISKTLDMMEARILNEEFMLQSYAKLKAYLLSAMFI